MSISVNALKYAPNALEPFISALTIEYHHGKHFQNYINTTNTLIADPSLSSYKLDELDLVSLVKKAHELINEKSIFVSLFNNAAQTYNHEFYFDGLSAQKVEIPTPILEKINQDFGSYEKFVEDFSKAAVGKFGSGWIWLVLDHNTNKLAIKTTTNAETPITDLDRPLLTLDVWEHAYYIDYKNARKAYVDAFFDHIDWNFVNKNLIG